jgi:hypothetical protein
MRLLPIAPWCRATPAQDTDALRRMLDAARAQGETAR